MRAALGCKLCYMSECAMLSTTEGVQSITDTKLQVDSRRSKGVLHNFLEKEKYQLGLLCDPTEIT